MRVAPSDDLAAGRHDDELLGIDWLEAGKHLFCLRQPIERNTVAHGKEFFPHSKDVGILVRGIEGLP